MLSPCKIKTGILAGSRRDLAAISAGNPSGSWRDIGHRDFSSWLESHRDPGKILARKRNSQRPKSCWDPTANLAKILAEEQIHSGKDLGAILPGILPRLATGSEILCEIHCGNLHNILAMLPQISFESSPMFTCLKYKQK